MSSYEGLFDYGLLPVCSWLRKTSTTEMLHLLVNGGSVLPKLQNNWNTFTAKTNNLQRIPRPIVFKRAEWKTKGAEIEATNLGAVSAQGSRRHAQGPTQNDGKCSALERGRKNSANWLNEPLKLEPKIPNIQICHIVEIFQTQDSTLTIQ
ncbi:hypothetical protein BDP81DRAFT_453857 [Colletotrichum phormii]|uniref:Uncharacterized protein n=1 Tax=Colletotrichum phormii TaxID=359342 RepID=A0AAJ0EC08_9PEZI|nr:uncharacterized protein BDP81DRAFT_453857 [Colletotrichum phormii]KAK1624243.1 hypothetical protein BDP81DRAFT_453857 [Colletotrichum phormii]